MKGFAHESLMTSYRHSPPIPWPGVLDHVPAVFAQSLAEPAFMTDEVSFCVWRTVADATWQIGPIDFPEAPDPDGSEYLLSILDGDPCTYQAFAESYFDGALVSLELIECVYRHELLTEDMVRRLNPAVSLSSLREDMAEIGYPSIL